MPLCLPYVGLSSASTQETKSEGQHFKIPDAFIVVVVKPRTLSQIFLSASENPSRKGPPRPRKDILALKLFDDHNNAEGRGLEWGLASLPCVIN